MRDPEAGLSPLRREITGGGTDIKLDSYRGEHDSGWIPEAMEEVCASALMDGAFDTDREVRPVNSTFRGNMENPASGIHRNCGDRVAAP